MAQLEVKSEISGSVFKIEAEVGAQVGEDDTIVILESMKMEIPVSAPKAGRVAEILVSEGDVITEGQLVAVLET